MDIAITIPNLLNREIMIESSGCGTFSAPGNLAKKEPREPVPVAAAWFSCRIVFSDEVDHERRSMVAAGYREEDECYAPESKRDLPDAGSSNLDAA